MKENESKIFLERYMEIPETKLTEMLKEPESNYREGIYPLLLKAAISRGLFANRDELNEWIRKSIAIKRENEQKDADQTLSIQQRILFTIFPPTLNRRVWIIFILLGISVMISSYNINAPKNATFGYHFVSVTFRLLSYSITLGFISWVIGLLIKRLKKLWFPIFTCIFLLANIFDFGVELYKYETLVKVNKILEEKSKKTNNNTRNGGIGTDIDWDVRKYNGIPLESRINVFNEDFNDNLNEWWVGENNITFCEIRNGYLHLECLSELASFSLLGIIINENEDFEIEANIKIVKGDNQSALVWGADIENGYRFYFSDTGYYSIYKFEGDFDNFYVNDTILINKRAYNKLTIRKVNNMYYFFINESLIDTMNFQSFLGNYVGFLSSDIIHADYLKIFSIIKMKRS